MGTSVPHIIGGGGGGLFVFGLDGDGELARGELILDEFGLFQVSGHQKGDAGVVGFLHFFHSVVDTQGCEHDDGFHYVDLVVDVVVMKEDLPEGHAVNGRLLKGGLGLGAFLDGDDGVGAGVIPSGGCVLILIKNGDRKRAVCIHGLAGHCLSDSSILP